MQLQNSSYKPSEVLSPIDLGSQTTETSPVEAIQQWLVSQLAKQLSLDPNNIKVQEPLTRYGLDSIDAVTLVGELEDWLELELPSTLLWDYPTIEKAATFLVQEFDVAAALNNVNIETATTAPQEKAEKSSGWGGLWNRISGS
ncbi:MAG: acyl carrier protein [Trichocoleus desertorum ATA4-8-CV12]|jgi:acyl carrier protein|nr:acyl carrier protein [Trichocoleus desertorum ATA4-8-CV12]